MMNLYNERAQTIRRGQSAAKIQYFLRSAAEDLKLSLNRQQEVFNYTESILADSSIDLDACFDPPVKR